MKTCSMLTNLQTMFILNYLKLYVHLKLYDNLFMTIFLIIKYVKPILWTYPKPWLTSIKIVTYSHNTYQWHDYYNQNLGDVYLFFFFIVISQKVPLYPFLTELDIFHLPIEVHFKLISTTFNFSKQNCNTLFQILQHPFDSITVYSNEKFPFWKKLLI